MDMKSKKEMRKEMLKARDCLTQEEVRRCSERICAVIAETEAYEKAGNICLYMPVRNEVEVTLMEKQARKDGKTLWIPKVEGEILTFYRWDEDMEMTTGSFGIREPSGSAAQPLTALTEQTPVLVIMPGTVFSERRDRIGYGGGYYDRFLTGRKNDRTIAVCYDFQIVKELPAEVHDVRPDMIVSEKRMIK